MEKEIAPLAPVPIDLGDGEKHALRYSQAARRALLSEYGSIPAIFTGFDDSKFSRALLLGLRHKYEGGNLNLTKEVVDSILAASPCTPVAIDLGDGEKRKLRFPAEARQALAAEDGSIGAMFEKFDDARLSRCLLIGLRHSFEGGDMNLTEEMVDDLFDVRLTQEIVDKVIHALDRHEMTDRIVLAFRRRTPEKNAEAPEAPAKKPILN